MAMDPVCGMQVTPEEAVAVSEYKGKKYYFCAIGCKKAFDLDPARYADEGDHDTSPHSSHKT